MFNYVIDKIINLPIPMYDIQDKIISSSIPMNDI